jgi:hypothetical protein
MTFFGMALLTAIATIVLAVFAIVTAWYARKAFRAQSQEVGLLLEQAKRDTDERRRAQASRVFLGAPPDEGTIVSPYARNASDFPVYDAQVWYVEPGTITGPDILGIILPGQTSPAMRAFDPPEALTYAYLTFRDAEGIYWTRGPAGDFRERQHVSMAAEIRDINLLIAARGPQLS